MGRPVLDLSGQRFGRLVANMYIVQNKAAVWLCQCDCGNEKWIPALGLRKGTTRSCGCLSAEMTSARQRIHGETGSPTFNTWRAMIDRCTRPSHKSFSRYGGAGVQVCERWHEFKNFLADMGQRPKGNTIDRFPNKAGHYEPGNCRWATAKAQAMNRIDNVRYEHKGSQLTIGELSRITGVAEQTIYNRLRAGLSVDQAVCRSRAARYSLQCRPAQS